MILYHDHRPGARVALSVASSKAPCHGAVRRIWCNVVRALSGETMAAICVNIFVLLLVLLHTMRALQQATCVIGGADLFQCLR